MRSLYLSRICAVALFMSAALFAINGQCLAQGCGCSSTQGSAVQGSCSSGCDSCSAGNFGDGAPCGINGFSTKLPFMGGCSDSCDGGASCRGGCGNYNNNTSSCNGGCGGGCDACSSGGFFSRFSKPKGKAIPRGPATGMTMFSRGSACGGDSCSGCDSDSCSRGGRAKKLGSRKRLCLKGMGGGLKSKLASMKPTGRFAGGATGDCGCDDGSCGDAGCGSGILGNHGGLALGSRLGGNSLGSHVGGNSLGSHVGGHSLGNGGCGTPGCGVGGRLCGRCQAKSRMGGDIPHRDMSGFGAPGMGGGPQTPSYAYPYYTTRAPRDFLQDNPPTIGW